MSEWEDAELKLIESYYAIAESVKANAERYLAAEEMLYKTADHMSEARMARQPLPSPPQPDAGHQEGG